MTMQTSEIAIIRASSLPMWSDCERRTAARSFRADVERAGFKLRYDTPGVGLAIGVGVHKAAETMLKEKAQSGKLPSMADVVDIAMTEFREIVKPGITFSRDTTSMPDAELQIRRMSGAYRETIAPEVHPMIVEERLEAQVSPLLILNGQPDVVAREPGAIRDTKTGTTRGNHRPQIGAYSLLARSHNYPIVSAFEDYIPRISIKKPQPPGQSFKHDLAGCETAAINVLRSMEQALRTFRQGDPERHLMPGDPWAFLANPASKLCGAKYCPAHGTEFCKESMSAEEVE